MADNYVRIGRTDFYLKSDRLNWIVARRVRCERSKSYPDGYKMLHETYHNRLSGAFERVFSEITKTAAVESIEDILRVCRETFTMLRQVLDYDFSEKKTAA